MWRGSALGLESVCILKGPGVQWEHYLAHVVCLTLHVSVIYWLLTILAKLSSGTYKDFATFPNQWHRIYLSSQRPWLSSRFFLFEEIMLWYHLPRKAPLVLLWLYFQLSCLERQANISCLNILARISSKREVWSLFGLSTSRRMMLPVHFSLFLSLHKAWNHPWGGCWTEWCFIMWWRNFASIPSASVPKSSDTVVTEALGQSR